MDLAAESRVKLARNNKVPRLGGIDAARFSRGQILYFSRRDLYYDVRPRWPIYSLVIGSLSRLTLYGRKNLAHLLALMLKFTIAKSIKI